MDKRKIHESWNDVLDLFQDSGEFTEEKYIEWLEQIAISTKSEKITLQEFKQAQFTPCDEATLELVLI